MTLPLPRAAMGGPNSWQGSNAPPTRFRSKLARQSSAAIFSNGRSDVTVTFASFPPAAFTSTVAWPKAASSSRRAADKLAASVASAVKNRPLPPAAVIRPAQASPRSRLRPSTATDAPAAASPSASAPPNTPVAPITTATSPDRSNRLLALLALLVLLVLLMRGFPGVGGVAKASGRKIRGGKGGRQIDPYHSLMTNPALTPALSSRRVLLWRPEPEETRVVPGLEQAAGFLKSSPDEVLAAIGAGDLLQGWFVDWEAAAVPNRRVRLTPRGGGGDDLHMTPHGAARAASLPDPAGWGATRADPPFPSSGLWAGRGPSCSRG